MTDTNYFLDIDVPNGVQAAVDKFKIIIKGKNGELTRNAANPRFEFSVEDNKVFIRLKKGVKFSARDKMMMNTNMAHLKNMLKGIQVMYKAKLKICSGHFPMQVTVQDNMLQIKNFLGEKVPRKTRFMDGVKVVVQGDIILVEGADKENVGQTAAMIEQSTRITNRDRRIFQDGVYIISKPGDEEQ